jgi:Flp pilus assembly protein TadD
MPGLDENLGRAAFSSYHFGAAIAPLTDYVSLHPNDETMRAALGVSLYMTNDYARAKAALQPVMQSGKVTDEVAYIYAECQLKTGQTAEGIAGLKALAAKLPQEENPRLALGEAYAAEGDTSHAIEELRVAEKLNEKDPQVHLDLAKAYEKAGQQQAAARETQQYQSLAGKSSGGKK